MDPQEHGRHAQRELSLPVVKNRRDATRDPRLIAYRNDAGYDDGVVLAIDLPHFTPPAKSMRTRVDAALGVQQWPQPAPDR